MATRPIGSDGFKAEKSVKELAREQGVRLGRPLDDFVVPDLWKSDEEVEAFIADTYSARRRDASG